MTEPIAASIEFEQRDGRRLWRRFPWIAFLCFFVVGSVIVMAIFGSLLTPYDSAAQDLQTGLAGPSSAHWLGTDVLGRDVFSRLIVGSRSAFLGPLIIAGGSGLLGSMLGLLAGYMRGWIDAVLMRWVDLMWAIPSLLIIIVVAGAFGGGYWFAVGLLTILTTPFDTRLVRAATLEQAPRPYVEAAKALGVPSWRIMVWHIWPNVAATVVANSFLVFAASLVALSGISFLGLGVSAGTPDWGLMLSESRGLLFANPVASLAPGAMIVLLGTSMNLIGDWLYERMSSRGATR
jgi:peptide/nickel transport system permease protein